MPALNYEQAKLVEVRDELFLCQNNQRVDTLCIVLGKCDNLNLKKIEFRIAVIKASSKRYWRTLRVNDEYVFNHGSFWYEQKYQRLHRSHLLEI